LKKIIYTPEQDQISEIEKIVSMFEMGADYLYLRKPEKDISYWYAYIEQFPYGWESKMITSEFKLLHDLKLGGFHFKRETLNNISEKDLIENLKMLKDSSIKSSVTAHDLSELNKYDGQFDIVLISPLFDSISKKEYHGNWDFEKLKIFIENRTPLSTLLIGQGGIVDKNVMEVQSLGLDGYALLGYLWNSSEDVIKNFKKLSDGDRG
jgi:thiamine-phosphate pyrophosphorylase